MKKLEKHLKLTCSHCFSTYQLLEIHEKENHSCSANCQAQWEKHLRTYYQEKIILCLAQEEANQEANQENHD